MRFVVCCLSASLSFVVVVVVVVVVVGLVRHFAASSAHISACPLFQLAPNLSTLTTIIKCTVKVTLGGSCVAMLCQLS